MNNTKDKPLEDKPLKAQKTKLAPKPGKRPLPRVIKLRYNAFIDKLFSNGFNERQAYKDVYGVTDDNVASAAGSRLLSNVKFAEVLAQRIVDDLVSKPVLVAQAQSWLHTFKNEQARVRIWENLCKIGKITDNQPIVNAVQVNISGALEDIINKRCKTITQPIDTQGVMSDNS